MPGTERTRHKKQVSFRHQTTNSLSYQNGPGEVRVCKTLVLSRPVFSTPGILEAEERG